MTSTGMTLYVLLPKTVTKLTNIYKDDVGYKLATPSQNFSSKMA